MDDERKKISRLRRCPSKLESLLEAMRMVPPTPRLMPFNEALALTSFQFPADATVTREAKALDFCLHTLMQSGSRVSEFLHYVWGPPQSRHQDPIKAIEDAIDRYEDFRIAREKVASLAKISRFHVDTRHGMRQLLRSLNIEIDEQGEVQPREDWFTKALKGVEAARIRECQVCEKIFWAGRIGLQGCSSRCLDVIRKRNKRKRDAVRRVGSNKQRTGRLRLNETEKQDLIRQTLGSGGLNQSQITRQTKLTADEVADVLRHLILESGEVSFEQSDETRIYFLKETQTQTVKSQQAENKRR